MKKILTAALLCALAVTGCADKQSSQEKSQKFNDEIAQYVNSFNTAYSAIKADTSLSEEQASEKVDSLYEEITENISELCLATIKANKNDSLGIEAFKTYYQFNSDSDDIQNVLASLGKKAKQDETIQKISAAIDAKLSTKEGCKFKDFEIDGVKFSDYVGKGKYILVDFWASWCGPCKREIPNIANVYKTYAGDDFDVLSVAVWDDPEATKAAAKEHGVVWNQIINAQKVPTDLYGINGIPQIMLFAPDGTILKRDLRGDDIEEAVKEALGR